MTKSISEDLRSRVIAAVDSGLSRRAAAERFGVAAASAVRWVREWRESGSARAKPQGGDMRSRRIEGHRDAILGAIEKQVDITLVELYQPSVKLTHDEDSQGAKFLNLWFPVGGHGHGCSDWFAGRL